MIDGKWYNYITELLQMDLNKERLKSRLNVKFEPLKNPPGSLKRLKLPERISKEFSKEKEK